MCPVCVANIALIAVSGSSTGGMTAFAVKKFFFGDKRNHQRNRTGGEQNENRGNGTEKKSE